MRSILVLFSLCLAIAMGASSVLAAGTLVVVAKTNYCEPLSGEKRTGCNKYWDVRITSGQTRSDALNNCNAVCVSDYKGGIEVRNCKTGCSAANLMDQ